MGDAVKDCGSVESQVTFFTERINYLSAHIQRNKHDYQSKRSLIKVVSRRRGIMKYLKSKDIDRYNKMLSFIKK